MSVRQSFLNSKSMKASFWILLISQGISNLGDTFQFLSTTMLLYNISGSGLTAAFGLICAPIPSITLSAFAGVISDRFPEKYILSLINLLRGLVVILFISNTNKWAIFSLIFILQILNVLSNPPGKKIMVKLLRAEDILIGNSVNSGISGVVCLVGPFSAGMLIDTFGVDRTLKIGVILFFISAVTLLFIRIDKEIFKTFGSKIKNQKWRYLDELNKGFNYYKDNAEIREIINVTIFISFATAAVNFAFYPFALEVLKVSSKGFGFMLSIFYGSNIAAMVILIIFYKKIMKYNRLFIFIPLLAVSLAWLVYGLKEGIGIIIIMQIVEGIASSLFATILTSNMQIVTKKAFMGRMVGICDLFSNSGRLIGVFIAIAIINFYSPAVLFIIFSIVLLIYVAFKLLKFSIPLIGRDLVFFNKKKIKN